MTGPTPLSLIPEVTTAEPDDIFYLVRDGIEDHRIAFSNLLKAVALVDHTHTISQVGGLQEQLTNLTSGLGNANSGISSLSSQLAGKAAASHTHTIGQIQALDIALNEKSPVNHGHSIGQITNLTETLAGKAPTTHNHTIVQIDGLDTALSGKASASHTHTASAITDFAESVDDRVAILLATPAGSGVRKLYDDTGNTLSLFIDIDGLTETSTIDPVNDYFVVRKAQGGSHFKVKGQYLPGTGGGTGTGNYVLPIAKSNILGGVMLGPQFSTDANGVLTLVSSGGTSQGQLRCVTPENFGGVIGDGKTDTVRRGNLSALNDMMNYCRTNGYGAYISGTYEISGGHVRQDNRGGAIHVFGHRGLIKQFSDGESIWEIAGDYGSFVDVNLEYANQQTSGDSVTGTGVVKAEFVIISGGTGYTSAPTITLTPDPRDASGFNATATATVSGGAVTAITLGNAGVRYTYPPIVSISGGGGSGATASAKVVMPHAGLRLLAARHNDIRHSRISKAWVGLLSTSASPSERNSIDQIDVTRPGLRGVSMTGGGSHNIGSIYVRGDGVVQSCEGGVFIFGVGKSSYNLIHVDSLACKLPVEISASNFGKIGTLKLTNIRPLILSDPPKNSVLCFVKSGSRGKIGSVEFDGIDLQSADSVNRPTRCKLFAYQNGASVQVLDVSVSNTKNKDASTSLVFCGPSGTVASDNRGMGFKFGQVFFNRDSAAPHLVDRLSDGVPDVPNSFTQAVLTFNQGLGGVMGYSAPWGDADVTIYPEPHGQYQEFNVPLTANRSVIVADRLDTPYVSDTVLSPLLCRGFTQTIVRSLTATGNFALLAKNGAGTTLATLGTPGDWVKLFYNGTSIVVLDASIQVTGDPKTVLGFDANGNAKAVPNLRAITAPLFGETQAVIAGTGVMSMDMPFPFKLTNVKLGASVGSTTGNITVNVKLGGATIFSVKPFITQGANQSGTSGKPTLTITDVPEDGRLTFDVDAPGTGAKGLKVYLIGYLT